MMRSRSWREAVIDLGRRFGVSAQHADDVLEAQAYGIQVLYDLTLRRRAGGHRMGRALPRIAAELAQHAENWHPYGPPRGRAVRTGG